MPIKCRKGKPRFRFRQLDARRRQRLAFCGNRVVEVSNYKRRNGKWVKSHKRRKPRR